MAEIIDLDPVPDPINNPRFPEGQPGSTLNDGDRDSEGITARAYRDMNGMLVTTGTSTAYTLAAVRTITAYYDGLTVTAGFHVACGAAPTLNVDSNGAAPLVWPDGTALAANDIPALAKVTCRYELGNNRWQVVSTTKPPFTGPIETADIADGAVTTPKIANNAVDGTKIAMGSDAKGDLLAHNGTDYVRLPVGTNGAIPVADSSEAAGIKWDTSFRLWIEFDTIDLTGAGPYEILGLPSSALSIKLVHEKASPAATADWQLELGHAAAGGTYSNDYDGFFRRLDITQGAWAAAGPAILADNIANTARLWGNVEIEKGDADTWTLTGQIGELTSQRINFSNGSIVVGGTLDRLRLSWSAGGAGSGKIYVRVLA